jgi:hypothetical protein
MRKLGVATKVLGGVVAFCALAFAPIELASAGCGDYLTIGHNPPMNGNHSDSLLPTTTPCNGPNCHRHDGPPLTPSPELRAAPPTVKSAAIFANLASDPKFVIERLSEDDARPLPGYADSILRPPQVV